MKHWLWRYPTQGNASQWVWDVILSKSCDFWEITQEWLTVQVSGEDRKSCVLYMGCDVYEIPELGTRRLNFKEQPTKGWYMTSSNGERTAGNQKLTNSEWEQMAQAKRDWEGTLDTTLG